MLNIALIRNPIQPDKREEHSTEHIAGQSLQEYIEPILADWPDTEFVISVNGNVIEKDDVPLFYPAVGDYVILMPVIGKGFGDILKTVLMIALVAWAGPAGMAMAGTTTATVMSGIYTGLIVGVGGAILNAIIPTTQESASVNYDPVDVGMSTSYGWNGSGVTEVPGTPVGRIYGTVSPTLVRLQRHVSTDGSNQYLNYLFSCGMGPVDSIQDMTIAGNPIANYQDVEYWTRLGTNDQATIANFNTNYDDYPLSYELENDSAWRTQRTEGNAVEGLEVMLQLPGGLYYTNDDASLGSASVTVECQYKLASSSTWIDMIPSTTITDANNAAIFKTFRVDNITSGQYDVRMRCTAKSGTTTRYSTRVYWVQLSEINYADFCYPNLVLWGVRIKATSQLSGSDPEFKCTVTRSKVWIWNPYTLVYEQKRATNPYWAGYDFLHHCEYLKNIQTGLSEFYVEGVAARRFDYDQYKRCADYADGLLPSGKYRFELNLFIEGNITVKEALNQIAMVGRGVFIPRGTKFSAICDMPMEMTTVFGDGRIITGSMAGEWQGVENRSRSVEVTFWNKENKYKKDMAPYQSPSYNEDGMIPNPTQLTYKGITDYEHAYLEAAFNGRCNEYKERTKSWQSDIDAIGCMIGDVVGVQSSTSRWGVGGRIVSATSNTVTLDQPVTLIAGQTYKIYLTLADDTMVQKTVVGVAEDTETNVLTLTEAFSVVPEKFDLYALGTSLALMRILSIVRANDLKAKITAEQYFAEIYDDNIAIPEKNYSDFTIKTLIVSVSEVLPRPADGTANLSVSWIWPRSGSVSKAVIYVDGQQKATAYIGDMIGTIVNVNAYGVHTIKVNVFDVFGAAIVASGSAQFEADTRRPPDVTSVYVEHLANGRKRIQWGYDYPVPNDVVGFRIKLQAGRLPYWDNAQSVFDGAISQSPWETDAIRSGVYTVMVKAVDASGNESANHAYCLFNVGDELVENVLQTADFKAAGWLGTKTNCSVNVDGELEANDPGDRMFSDRNAPMFTDRSQPMFTAQYGDIIYEDSFIAATSGNLLVQVGCDGTAEVEYRVRGPNPMFTNRASPMFSARGLPMFTPGAYLPYTSKIAIPKGRIDIRVKITGARLKPTIHSLAAIVDVEDEIETLNDVAISSAGTRLPITKTYHSIKNISATIQFTGTGAQSIQTLDKDAVLGPLVKPFNASGVAVDAVADITIQGIKFVE